MAIFKILEPSPNEHKAISKPCMNSVSTVVEVANRPRGRCTALLLRWVVIGLKRIECRNTCASAARGDFSALASAGNLGDWQELAGLA